MYAEDVPLIAAYARTSPDALADVCTFVLLSIRVPFKRVGDQMREVRRHGREASCLWGWKQEGYDAVQRHKASLHLTLPAQTDPANVIDALVTTIPGLAIVKGAFVAQLLGFNVACFDTRNLEALGYLKSDRPFRLDPCTPKTRLAKIAAYVEATRASGGAEHWWNHWCRRIAPGLGISAENVSNDHWRIIAGARHATIAHRLTPLYPVPIVAPEIPF